MVINTTLDNMHFAFQNVYYILKSSLSICQNVASKVPEAKSEFNKANAVEVRLTVKKFVSTLRHPQKNPLRYSWTNCNIPKINFTLWTINFS